jgi:hypothetical protein
MTTATTAQVTKVVSVKTTTVASPKTKIVTTVAVTTQQLPPKSIAPTAVTTVATAKIIPGADTTQPVATGAKKKVTTTSPTVGVVVHSVIHY